MTANDMTATIELFGKPYQVRCRESELPALQKAAEYLNTLARSLSAGRQIATEKLGIMLALNLASQMAEREHYLHLRLSDLQNKLENILTSEVAPTFRLEVESA